MPDFIIEAHLSYSNRVEQREELIKLFTNEHAGTGRGELSTKYTYTIDSFQNYDILLKRPGSINKGFDFAVQISGIYFKDKIKKHAEPNHDNIVYALQDCKNRNPEIYEDYIIPIIIEIYNGRNIVFDDESSLGTFYNSCDNKYYPIELILLTLKWLFAEQDFTYWNYSGRQMLYSKLQGNDLV